MMLVAEGRLDLDATVGTYLPWWTRGDPRKTEVTVRQLLLHRAGLAAFRQWFFDLQGEEAYRNAAADEPLVYRKQVGPWDSVCSGLMHPAPESGDFFSWERCFEPSVGITRLVFHSVWGAYEAQLTEAPAGFALP